MSNADRIEELRSKYEENPRRYFAPLANEYRKAGDLAQAIAICREHLPKQPGHMSGYIVFGQTLFEAQSLDDARSVFEQALTLDPENLIALKHLGDIARLKGENSVARRWYARVLDADPRNDDIASQLAALGAPTPAMSQPAIPEPAPYQSQPQDEAVGVFATFDPTSLLDVPADAASIAGGNEFWAPTPENRPPVHHEPLDLDFPESPEPEAHAEIDEAEFEEGIIAPEWPDTADLVARVVTPMRSATPIAVPAIPEAMEAFGRELTDPVEEPSVDLQPADELVDAFVPPEVSVRAAQTPETAVAEAADDLLEFSTAEFAVPHIEHVAKPSHNVAGDTISPQAAIDTADEPRFEEHAFEPSVMADEAGHDEPETLDLADIADEPAAIMPFASPVEIVAETTVPAAPSWSDASEELPVYAADSFSLDADPVDVAAADEMLVDELLHDSTLIESSNDTGSLIGESLESPVTDAAEFAEPVSVGTFEPLEAVAFEEALTEAAVGAPEIDADVTSEIPVEPADADEALVTAEWSEPESVPVTATGAASVADDDDVSFAAGLPWESALSAGDLEETAEFPVQTSLRRGAHDAEDRSAIEQADANVAGYPEVHVEAQPEALDSSLSVPEESFAAISSELEHERSASDFDATGDIAADDISSDDIATDVAFETAASSESVEDVFAEVVTPETSVFEPVAEAAPDTKVPEDKAPTFVTETMAELLISQGFRSRAIDVYEELVRRRPHDPVLVSRLAQLRALEQAEGEQAATAARAATPRYNTPVSSTPLSNTPIVNQAIAPTPLYNTPISNTPIFNTPVYATPHAGTPHAGAPQAVTPLSVTPLSSTPVSSTPIASAALSDRFANERAQAFRTAREKFAELSRRRVARRTPTHATAVSEDPAEGLSSLFGTSAPTNTDELAARALAVAFGPVQDSGESLFDPRPTPTSSMPIRALTPRANTAIPSATNLDTRSDRLPSADYSFDKFFPDPAMASRETSSPTTFASPPTGSQPVNEDLAQFSAWLKGLNNT
ncbi:MAG: tetratricopeptide repeat protein [Gemmatimonas sp.]